MIDENTNIIYGNDSYPFGSSLNTITSEEELSNSLIYVETIPLFQTTPIIKDYFVNNVANVFNISETNNVRTTRSYSDGNRRNNLISLSTYLYDLTIISQNLEKNAILPPKIMDVANPTSYFDS